jgi:hypothetical protein
MSRTSRQRLLAFVGAGIALASLPLLALADVEISARGWSHDRYGRLVFDRAARLATSAEIQDRKLVITFTEPVSVKLTGALANLKSYLAGPVSAQGRRIELDLAQPATLDRWEEEGKLVLDLRPAKAWPGEQEAVKSPQGEGSTPTADAPKVPALQPITLKPAEKPKPAPTAQAVQPAKAAATSTADQAAKSADAPGAEPPRIIKPGSGARGAQPASGAAIAGGIVARHGDHGTFLRVAIDWPSKVGYRLSREGERIEVTFTQPGDIDLSRVQRNLPKDLVRIAAINDGVARVYLTMAPGARLRDFRLGRTIVLDIMRPAKQTASAPALRLPDKAQTAPPQPSTARQPGAPPTIPAAPEPATIAAPPVAPPVAPSATATEPPAAAPSAQPLADPPQPAPQFALQSLPALPEAAPVPAPQPTADAAAVTGEAAQPKDAEQPAQNAEPAPPPMPEIEQAALPPRVPVDVQIRVAPAENGAKIVFAWPETVAAAAFRRNGALWLAFDMPSNDVGALFEDARIAKLGKASKLDVPDATVIRVVEASPLGVSMTATGKTWIVDVTSGGEAAPARTIEQRREKLADGASSLLLQTNGPGRVASVTDPSGGELYIVPVRPPGLGIAEQAGWPEFQLLPSQQGVAIASLGDAITVDSLPQGIVVTTRPEGALGPIAAEPQEGEQIASQGQQPGEEQPAEERPVQAPQPAIAEQPILASVPGLFDLPSWRRGGEATFTSDQRRLESAVTAASEADKAAARMALGEFYFAHGLIGEADSALSQIGREGRSDLDQRQLALLAGAIQTLDGQPDKARASLSGRSLQGVAEANLFQGLLAAREEKWEEAAQYLTDGLPDIRDYPKPIRERIYLDAGAALNSAGNPIAAQRFADALRMDGPDRNARDRLTYLDARIALKLGERDQALALLAGLAESPLDDIKARSQFDLVEERLKGGELKPAEAIAPLEALRFVNRGGDFEFKLLRKLGSLYLSDNQPREGLVALRAATANFPKRPEAKEIGEQMATTFRELYLENGADRLSPLSAVALYDEFRELTPAGADGDRMLSLLADRLVTVDLLGRAGELLDGLVAKRLSGLEKVHAGTRLAAIRMLDQKPELALKALKDSEIDQVLPPDLAAERRRLEARATFDSGDTLGGIRMLEGDGSLEAKWLRADMQWRVREWPAAATALGDLIAGEEQAMAAERAALKEALDPAKNPAASVGAAEAEGELRAKQEQHFKERIAPLLLNRAVAQSLAADRRGLKALANDYGERMEGTDQAKAFAMLTAADNGLVESVSAEMASVDRINAFVTDYRERLKKASLSTDASGTPSATN